MLLVLEYLAIFPSLTDFENSDLETLFCRTKELLKSGLTVFLTNSRNRMFQKKLISFC